MKDINPLRRTIGLILIMIGSFWAAISLGFLEESFMTGQPVYTVLGLGVVIAGVLVLVVRPKSPPAADPPAQEPDTQEPDAPQPE
ncbi:MAG: hypothetical protein WEA35_01990 [Candidatus Nanopelagicales bacterium]